MKQFIVFAMVLGFMLPAVAASSSDVTGKWSGSISVKDQAGETHSQPVFFVLKQDGKALTGTAGQTEEEQEFEIANGKVDGNKLSFDVNAGGNMYRSTGEFTADQITGDTVREGTDGVKATFKLTVKRVVSK